MGRYWTGTGTNRKLTAEGRRHAYKKFQSSAKAKTERAARNKARRTALRKGIVQKGDGRELDHKRGLADGGSNSADNLRVVSRSTNRSRSQGSRKRGSRRNKAAWGK